ncbi:unnamed protein product [Cylindrotheca closterium]|uniref:Uncharacterized protein n=1 Tax=Cylindrotheca closterium TaxID=2856 RepID=A0AAD2JME2_9STRA|nr:unnamed protein product [Cylindrotheca closterium]
MMRRIPADDIVPLDAFSLCGSRISISLSTIQEECSFDYFSSQSSFGTVSSFDSAMISAESLCSGCRFDSVATKNKTSKLMPPSHPRQPLKRPTEIIFEGLDEVENSPSNTPIHNNLMRNARRPKRSSFGSRSSSDGSCSTTGDGAEYTQPLNDDDDGERDSSCHNRRFSSLTMDDFDYMRPLNDEDREVEYSRPLNDGPYHPYSNIRYGDGGEEKVEEDGTIHRFSDSDLIRHFDDMRLLSSPMASPESSSSSKSRSYAMQTAMREAMLSNRDNTLRSLDD